MIERDEAYMLDDGAGTTLTAARDGQGLMITIGRGEARATVAPWVVELPDGTILSGRWTTVERVGAALEVGGALAYAGGQLRAALRLAFDLAAQPVQPLALDWQLTFDGAALECAVRLAVTLHDLPLDPALLELPSIHYGRVTYGTGLFPHPDPRHGFAFRADRLAQCALHYSAPGATWSIFTASETPTPALPELLYALGAEPGAAEAAHADLTVYLRYPQHEHGHHGDGSPEAYVAKDIFAAGEQCYARFAAGSTLADRLWVLCRPPAAAYEAADVMRYLWRCSPSAPAQPAASLLHSAGQRVQWFNWRLYNRELGGGQYESPEGSGTAMLGFVEQSLLMASTTLRYALLLGHAPGPASEDLVRLARRAAGALTRWATFGLSPEGLLYPACHRAGYAFGSRRYSDYEQLTIDDDQGFDTIRLAFEARSLLAAAVSLRLDPQADPTETRRWVAAALSVAEWLRAHPLPAGGYAARYHRTGQSLDPYPSGTATVIGLFCDCARLLAQDQPQTSAAYAALAGRAFTDTLAGAIDAGVFVGGTLDASCPDREAAIAALDACITLYETLGDERYLGAARVAANNVLTYTLTYDIRTFAPDTDAVRRGIATRGAMIVSPENQHLDPVTSAPALLVYGLYADDPVAVEAAVASLRWAMDGRWAHVEPRGVKQSEQMLHTRWYYNTFFSRRGDVRVGMPLWGRTDSEHGWPQVVPTASLLATGQIVVDWPTGRAASVEPWLAVAAERGPGQAVALALTLTQPADAALLRICRLPVRGPVRVRIQETALEVDAAQLAHGWMLPLPRLGRLTVQFEAAEA